MKYVWSTQTQKSGERQMSKVLQYNPEALLDP